MVWYELTLYDIWTFLTKLSKWGEKDNDFADRLSSSFTSLMLVIFSFLVFALSWIGSPISCWAPQHFISSHVNYANSYCWVRNTYYLPFYEVIPGQHEER